MIRSPRSIFVVLCLAAAAAPGQDAGQAALNPTPPAPTDAATGPTLASLDAKLDRILSLLAEQGRQLERARLERQLELARDRQSVAERVLVETTREWDALETEGVRLAAHLEELTTQLRGSDLDEERQREQLDAFGSQTTLLRKNLEDRQQQVAERLGELARQLEEQEAEVRRWQARLAEHDRQGAAPADAP